MTGGQPETVEEESMELMVSCVRRALQRTLGNTGTAATLYILEFKYALGQKQFSDSAKLTFALRDLFGLGSAILLKAIEAELRSSNPNRNGVRVSIEEFAKQVDQAAYAVEHGLG